MKITTQEAKAQPALQEDTEQQQQPKKKRFKNIQRTLIFASRGITATHRHLMRDLKAVMPHAKSEAKFDGEKQEYEHINEVCAMKKCTNCIFLEAKNHGKELFMYFAKSPNGPTVKFAVTNISTMDELKLTGNCLKYSRPLLHFDSNFDSEPHLQLTKELFTQVFASPKEHPKNKPFFDHVFSFFVVEGKIWFRNFQIVDRPTSESGGKMTLAEIGPRFVLHPVRILSASFSGNILYNDDFYISLRQQKQMLGIQEGLTREANKRSKQEHLRLMEQKEIDPIKSVWYQEDQE